MTLKTRIKIAGLFCLIPALFVAVRLFYLQTFRYGDFAKKAERRAYTNTSKDVIRGRILDRNGVVLAESLRAYSVGVSKRNVNKKAELFDVLEKSLGVKKSELNNLWDQHKTFFYVKKKVTPVEYDALEKMINKNMLMGLEVEDEYTRIYPFEGIAQDIIGATNSKNKGLSGVELLYNKELSDETKSNRVKKSASGGIIYDKSLDYIPNIADVKLTIDALGQYYVESTLKEYALKYKVKHAFALVQEVKTGKILAAASFPARDGLSLPFQFAYEPGSTFKSITVAAGLDSGKIKPQDIFSMDNNAYKVSGRIIKDVHPSKKPYLSVTEIMEISSNIGTAKIAGELGSKEMYTYSKKFGFGVKSNVAFLGESAGILRDHTKWKPLDTAKAGYGYTIAATGIQIVGAYSAIANGGNLMQAHLVDRIIYNNGSEKVLAEPMRIRQAISENTAKQLTAMLEGVVDDGTGKKASVAGYRIAGKTGTSEKMDEEGKYQRSAHIASFCGFLPVSDPKFTILVVLDEPERALFGAASADIFSKIAQKFLTLYAVEPDANPKEKQ